MLCYFHGFDQGLNNTHFLLWFLTHYKFKINMYNDFSQSPFRAKQLLSVPDFYDKNGRPLKMEPMNLILDPVRANGVNGASAAVGGIWLGSLEAASDLNSLKRHNIGAVLSLCPQEVPLIVKQYLRYHQMYYAEDVETFNIAKHFDSSYDFIEKALRETNLLIHCYAGISRSTTVLVAYMMRKRGMGLKECLDLVKAKRWQIFPNSGEYDIIFLGFIKQLQDFQLKLRNQHFEEQLHSKKAFIKQPEPPKVLRNIETRQSYVQQPVRFEDRSSTAQRYKPTTSTTTTSTTINLRSNDSYTRESLYESVTPKDQYTRIDPKRLTEVDLRRSMDPAPQRGARVVSDYRREEYPQKSNRVENHYQERKLNGSIDKISASQPLFDLAQQDRKGSLKPKNDYLRANFEESKTYLKPQHYEDIRRKYLQDNRQDYLKQDHSFSYTREIPSTASKERSYYQNTSYTRHVQSSYGHRPKQSYQYNSFEYDRATASTSLFNSALFNQRVERDPQMFGSHYFQQPQRPYFYY